MYNNATNSETKEVVVDVGETGGDVVRWWPAGIVRGPAVQFCGRYDAMYSNLQMPNFNLNMQIHQRYIKVLIL